MGENNLTRNLFIYLKITSSAWRWEFKRVGKIWCDELTRIYAPEGEVWKFYSRSVDRSKVDKDLVAGRYCIHIDMYYTWCIWEEGSRCFFWRWPRDFRRAIRYEKKQWQVGTWTRFVLPQREGKEAHTDKEEVMKLNKAQKRGYISTGEVKSLTHYF